MTIIYNDGRREDVKVIDASEAERVAKVWAVPGYRFGGERLVRIEGEYVRL